MDSIFGKERLTSPLSFEGLILCEKHKTRPNLPNPLCSALVSSVSDGLMVMALAQDRGTDVAQGWMFVCL